MSHTLTPLPPVPAHVCAHRAPLYGRYQGTLPDTDLAVATRFAGLRLPNMVAAQKRWQWFCAMDSQIAIGGAVVRLGYMGQCFFWIFDRSRGRFIAQHSAVLPPGVVRVTQRPGGGELASTQGRGVGLKVERPDASRILVSLDHKGARAELVFEAPAQEALTAICPVGQRRTNVTIKQSGVHVHGWVQGATGERWEMRAAEGWGFLDYTHGLLPYHTVWKWATGAGVGPGGERVGFNLIDGFNQGYENAMWHRGKVFMLPDSTLSQSPNWRAESAQVALTLQAEGSRQEEIDFKLIASRYVQPLGRWQGEVAGMVLAQGVGVAEEHEVRW